MLPDIVSIATADGLCLRGVYFDAAGDTTIVHIHGKCGNFYENSLVATLGNFYASLGCNFLAFNNRGANCIGEVYRDGSLEYVGGSTEIFRECVYDVTAGAEFAKVRSPKVILQGHSHGCEKVLYSCHHGVLANGIVLLSPCDSRTMQEVYIAPESLASQVARLRPLRSADQLVLMPESEFGVKTARKQYYIPTVRDSLLAWIGSEEIGLFRYPDLLSYPPLDIPTFAYVGGNDDLQLGRIDDRISILQRRFSKLTVSNPSAGDHFLEPVQEMVAQELKSWLYQARLVSSSP